MRSNQHPKWQFFLTFVLILYNTVGLNYSNVAAAGATYYVDNTNAACSDSGTGLTAAAPFCTISKAANLAVAGDTVQVLAGTYAETVNGKNSGSAGLPITYTAAPGVTVSGNGLATGGNAFRITTKSYIVVNGFTITGTADYGIFVSGSNNITLSNNHISYSGQPVSGSTRAGIYINSTTTSTISGNTTDHNSSDGILLTNGANNNLVSNNLSFANAQQYQRGANGINLGASNNNTILHNITYANEDSGVNVISGSGGNLIIGNLTYGNGGHGIEFNAAPNSTVIGNTVQGNVTSGINFEGSVAPGSGSATVANNIMVDNGLRLQVGGGTASGNAGNLRFDTNSSSGNTLDYNLYYLNSGTVQIIWGTTSYATLATFQSGVAGQEAHGLQANPLFVVPALIAQRPSAAPFNVTVNVGDYHIQASSPAIDSANSNASNEPNLDLDGNARMDDPSTTDTGAGTRTYDDRGAYEFQPAIGATLPTVTTQAVTNITDLAATGNGTITYLGVPNPTQYGVVWDAAANPTIALATKTAQGVPATGAFTSNITGLASGTLYHVRAYATNSAGTAYGEDVTFTTLLTPAAPTVTTQAVTNITQTSATGNGTVTALGVPNPTDHGVVWSTAANPTIADNITTDGPVSTTGAFTSNITGLTAGTLYHVRAYATNSVNTSYGTDVTFTSALAANTTYYVDNTNASCSDSGTGLTAAAPFCTIGKAASVAVAGNTLQVMAGTYAETVNGANSGSAGLPITYTAASGVTVTGNGSTNGGSAFRLSGKSYIAVNGFTVTGTADYGIYVFGSNNITLSNNHVSYSGTPGSSTTTRVGIYINSTTNSTISGNTTDHNSSHGILLTNGANNNLVSNNVAFANAEQWQRNANGIQVNGATSVNNTITHNIMYANEDTGLQFLNSANNNIVVGDLSYGNGDHGIDFSTAPNNIVVGNTVQGNVTSGINFEGTASPGSGGATVLNNILVDNGLLQQVGGGTASGNAGNLRFDAFSLANDSIDYNIFYLNSGTVQIIWGTTSYTTLAAFQAAVPGQEVHGLQANPLFVAPATVAQRPASSPYNVAVNVGDYHPMAGSPAIDSANSNVPNEPLLDLDGNPRVDDPATTDTGSGVRTYDDRGAYEFQPVAGAILPTVTTQVVTNIALSTATANGNITDLGLPNPMQHGVVWSTVANPTVQDNRTTDGSVGATGAFTSNMTGLGSGITYHVRAYATNSAGTAYGEDVTFTSAVAPGTTYYVDKTNVSCSDSGTGLTTAQPFCTIGKAASIAVAGNTVQVLAGTYAETVNGKNSGSAGQPITYTALPGVTVTGNGLANGGSAFRISGKSYIVINGFTITGTADYGIYTFGSNNITISNNHVSYSGQPVSSSNRIGVYINSTTNSTISGNTSDHNSYHGIHLINGSNNNLIINNITFANAQQFARDASGIRLEGSANNTVLHNISYGNEDSGITNYYGASGNFEIGNLLYGNGDHGIDDLNSPNNTMIGNTIQGNVTTGINFEGTASPGSGGATVMNNVLVDNGLLQQVGGGVPSGMPGNLRFDATSLVGDTFDYNIFYHTSSSTEIQWNGTNYPSLAAFQAAVSGYEAHGLQTNPFLMAPAPIAQRPASAPYNVTVNVGDYHLMSGSPAIDSAYADPPNQPVTDLENNARVDDPFTTDTGAGTRTYDDRGAYEFQPVAGAQLATVTTQAVAAIGSTGATGNGTITALGIPNPTQHGVVWSIATNPTVQDNKTMDGPISATGAFTSNITGLASGIIYHVRAYAWNAAGIAYGDDVTFTSAYKTYYVDNTNAACSNTGTGLTTAQPFCTISKAASLAAAGDTVQVLAGTYAETVNGANSGAAGLPITYTAAPGVTVTGNGSAISGGAFRLSGKSYIVVNGFTVTSTADYGLYVSGSNNITLSNNHVSYAGTPVDSTTTRSGIYINSTTNSTISGNTTDHNSSHGIQLNGANNNLLSNNISFANAQQWQRDAAGIRLDGSTNNTILHNTSYGNEDSGVTNYTGSSGNFIIGNLLYGNGDHGVDDLNSPNNTVIGNTIQGNVTTGINFEGTVSPGSGGATVMNNVLVDNGLRTQVGGGTSAGQPGNLRFDALSLVNDNTDYNLFYLTNGNVQVVWGTTNYPTLAAFQAAVPGAETNGLQANPFFIAPAPVAQRPAIAPYNVAVNAGDYHLISGSPAIDSANSNASNESTLDIEGNARMDDPFTTDTGAGVRTYDDRGVYEFQPVAGAALPTVTTQAVTNVTQSLATGNSTITDLGIPNPTQHGVVWSIAANPTIQENRTADGPISATGAFTSNITGLASATLYHVRAYAWNAADVAYGADVTFTTPHATYYVDNTNVSCSDSGLGAATALPFCTIGKAASLAVAGDTVQVLAGTYAETVNGKNSGSAGLLITYTAAPGVIVSGNGLASGGNAFRIISKSYTVVNGFTITGTVDYGIYISGSNNITITNNHVSYSGQPVSGSTRGGIYLTGTSNSTISGNTTDHNSDNGIYLTTGSINNLVSNNLTFGNAQQWQRDASGIRLDGTGTTNNTILHNISYGNEDSGITNYTGASGNYEIGNLLYGNGDHGIDDLNSPNNVIIGNTAQGNVTTGLNFEGTASPGSGGATVINNVLMDNGLRLQVGGGTSAGQPGNIRFDATSLVGDTFDYNIYYLTNSGTQIQWNGTNYSTLSAFQTAVPGQETHGLQANPLFSASAPIAQRPASAPYSVAVNVGDYHIQAGSPAIDSANSSAPNEPTLDLDGSPRADDPATTNTGAGVRTYDDRGVYEFQPLIVTTQAVTNITQTTATGNGNITALGVSNPTQHGVVWSTSRNPTIANNKTTDGPVSATGAFTSNITGLVLGTTYHVRAYATNSAGTSYGADVSFTTLAGVLPTVTTQAVTNITQTTATGNGNITSLGAPNPTQYGVVWGTSVNPTVSLSTKTTQGAPIGTGAFTSNITGLTPGTLYHVRAYATNSVGTAYGADVTLTALAAVAPTVTTQTATNITQTTATGNGNITSLGAPNPTQYGVVWSTTANPTVSLSTKTAQGVPAGTGAFTSNITGLTANTTYHVRAYATNAAGTIYGADVTFTTLANIAPSVTTQAVTNITQTTATGNGNITSLGAPNPTQYGVVWDTASNPTVALSTKTAQGVPAGTGAFTSNITGLTANTTYHVRAYVTNAAGTVYGADVTFTTLANVAPSVTTQAVTNITKTTATGNGNITSLGAPNPTQYGVVWSTTANPTVSLSTKTTQGVPTSTGPFTSSITGLKTRTTYHVRAYVTNAAGTFYGVDVTFTTP